MGTHVSVSWRSVDLDSGRASRPRASGDHGVHPTPRRCPCITLQTELEVVEEAGKEKRTFSIGIISRSSSRYNRLWWFSMLMKGVRLCVIA